MQTGRNLEPAVDLAKEERVMARETLQYEVEDLRKESIGCCSSMRRSGA